MIDIEEIVETIAEMKRNKNKLGTLLDFEKILDDLNIYAYRNWIQGEVIKGPVITKFWVEVYLMYPEKFMPDPDAALRLIKHGCHVFYKKEKLLSTVKIKSPDDLVPEKDPRGRRKPKTKEFSVYVIKIVLPKHLLGGSQIDNVDIKGTGIDLDDIIDAYEKGMDITKINDEGETDKPNQDEPSPEGPPDERA